MNASITHAALLQLIHLLLIEIRGSRDPLLVYALADIAHNAPNKIARNVDADAIYKDMSKCAERHGKLKYLDGLLKHVLEREV